VQDNASLIAGIDRYIVENGLSRAKFAALLGVSTGTIDKLMTGHLKFSAKMLMKIETKTGLVSHGRLSAFDFEIGRPERHICADLEGEYQVVRPSYQHENTLYGYSIVISWDAKIGGLVFEERQNDLSPKNKGCVSVPVYNRMLYLLSCEKGNFRLMMLSDAYQPGLFYGGVITVGSKKMADKTPTAAILALKKLADGDAAVVGHVQEGHEHFEHFQGLLTFARKEGFFRVLA
jgi:transcriptional regulator with XRE-family HTH domain